MLLRRFSPITVLRQTWWMWLILLIVFLIYASRWPGYLEAQSESKPMPVNSPRTAFIERTVQELASKNGIETPMVREHSAEPTTYYAYRSRGLILLSPCAFRDCMRDKKPVKQYTEQQVRGLLAHELAHIIHRDSLACLTGCSYEVNLEQERAADKLAVKMGECEGLRSLFIAEDAMVRNAAGSEADPHPSFEERMAITSECAQPEEVL